MNKNILPFLSFIVVLIAGYFLYQNSNNADEIPPVDDISANIMFEAPKTSEEVVADVVQGTIEMATDKATEHKTKKDSIRLANRKSCWVYQIGMNKSTPHDFEYAYHKLKGSVSNIYLFKDNDHSYFLVKNDGYSSEQELLDAKNEMESTLQHIGLDERVFIANLTSFCSLKKDVALTAAEKVTKEEKIDCYECR